MFYNIWEVNYELSIGTKIGNLERPWTPSNWAIGIFCAFGSCVATASSSELFVVTPTKVASSFWRYKGHQYIHKGSSIVRVIVETRGRSQRRLRGPQLARPLRTSCLATLGAFWDLQIIIVGVFCPLSQLTMLNTTDIDIFTLQRLYTAVTDEH